MSITGTLDLSKLQKDFSHKMKKSFQVSIGFKGKRLVHGRSISNRDIALWNFLGTKNIPSRNPLEKTSLKGIEKQKDFKNFLSEKRFNSLNKFLKIRVKQAFYRKYVKNAPSTIRQKGFNQPLIWTGALRDSVVVNVKEVKK